MGEETEEAGVRVGMSGKGDGWNQRGDGSSGGESAAFGNAKVIICASLLEEALGRNGV